VATSGSVLFVSGPQASAPFAHQAHVSAAKAGINALMRVLAVEWGPSGVRSNAITPGPVVDTEGMRRLSEGSGADVWRSMVPLGRFANQDEVGVMAAILLSPLGSYVNGAELLVDGGLSTSGAGLFNRSLDEDRDR